METIRNYKNIRVVEILDDNNNIISYRQENDSVTIIHREWTYDQCNRILFYKDNFTNYWKTYNYPAEYIVETVDSDGRKTHFDGLKEIEKLNKNKNK